MLDRLDKSLRDLTDDYGNLSIVDDEYNADDALLVFDPGDSGYSGKMLYSNPNLNIANCTVTTMDDHSHFSTKAKKTGRKNKVVHENEELFSVLERRVKSNEKLYSRILRFEVRVTQLSA